MPDITTHLNLSSRLINDLNPENLSDYYIGTIAPDMNHEADQIKISHFLNEDSMITLEILKLIKEDELLTTKSKSYKLGYLSHLFLDYYMDQNKEQIFLYSLKEKADKIKALHTMKHMNYAIISQFKLCETDAVLNHEAYDKLKDLITHSGSYTYDELYGKAYEALLLEIVSAFKIFMN